MTKISELHRRWSKTAEYTHAYEAREEEFDLARTLIEARTVVSSPNEFEGDPSGRSVQP
jgi:hypothetical protein